MVGYYEQNRKGSYTPLDIPPSNRNQVLRQKSLIIGCGGGFQQECGQPFSPVADWMSTVDLFLEDEGQQYGNMEEAASVARTPATCLEVWSGDHRQTPGGLKKEQGVESLSQETHQTPPCSERRLRSLIKLWLGFGTQSWSHPMGQVGTLASMSHRRNHYEEVFFQYSGMFHVLIRMLLRTLEQLSSGSQNAAPSMPMPNQAWQCCTIATT